MNEEVIKQIIFDCVMELYYEHEDMSKKDIGDKLMYVLRKMDENEDKSKGDK